MSRILLGAVLWTQILGALGAREIGFSIRLKIVDDDRQQLSGVETRASFENGNATEPSDRVHHVTGKTDGNGIVELRGKTAAARIGFGAHKEGYYFVSGVEYRFTDARLFRWQPWNPTIEVVLKRIKNPVPMYAKRVESSLSVLGETVGYDLEAGDWVSPHGKGRIADFSFLRTLQKLDDDNGDFEVKVTFANPGDGIQRFQPDPESTRFRSPYEAPAEGYKSEWTLKQIRRPGVRDVTDFNPNGGYFFRVRTVLDDDGQIVKACYGKIYGEFFTLAYYLNPDGTRNLEFDPDRNLLRPALVTNREYLTYSVGP